MHNTKFNKKGDVPVMILVLGVFAICAIALLSFYFVNFKALKNFQGYLAVEETNSLIENYLFYKNVGLNQDDIQRIAGVEDCPEGKCLAVNKIIDGKSIRIVMPVNLLK